MREAFAYSPATKAVVINDPEAAAAYVERIRDALGDRVYATRSYPEFVEILNPAVDKGDALRFVARHLGIAMSDVAAIGDSWNDAPLLEAAGMRIAMGSAPKELLEIAHGVVGDVVVGAAEVIRLDTIHINESHPSHPGPP